MSLVKCARFPDEQNLIAVQVEGQIFYEACKDIQAGQELLVWYGDCYMQFLGIPLTLREAKEDSNALLPTEGPNLPMSRPRFSGRRVIFTKSTVPPPDAGEGFKCDRCGKVFAYKYYRDKHLKYTRCVDQGDRKFPCHLCNRSFEKRDRLRIHILHVHEKHRPHKVRTPRSLSHPAGLKSNPPRTMVLKGQLPRRRHRNMVLVFFSFFP